MSQEAADELDRLRNELYELDALLELLIEANPDGIAIVHPDGRLRVNAAGAAIAGASIQGAEMDEWAERYGLFLHDGVTPYPTAELPLTRALRDRVKVDGSIVWLRSEERPDGAWLSGSATPLPDGSAVALFHDITTARQLADALSARTEALEEREKENRELVVRLRLSLDELSTPVLDVWEEVLAVPIVGMLDTQRSAQMTEKVLAEVVTARARWVIVDLTGVDTLDTSTADRLLKLAGSVRLLGAECVVCGIQPAVARTMVALGVQLDELVTKHNLEHALAHCVRRSAQAGSA